MPYTALSNVSTGELATAALHNTLIGNVAELRAGGIAIASQAALDFIYASSATQLARLIAPGALQSIRINAGGTAWEAFTPSPMTGYTPTIADVANTTAKTTILAFTIGANVMADGDTIYAELPSLAKQNKGTNGTYTWELAWGATVVAGPAAIQINNSTTERSLWFLFKFQRVGANVWVRMSSVNVAGVFGDDADIPTKNFTADNADYALVLSGPTLSSSQSVEVRVTLSAADATFYVKPQQANVYRVAKQ